MEEGKLFRLSEVSVTLTAVLTVIYGIVKYYLQYSGIWNLLFAVVVFLNLLVTIYLLRHFYRSAFQGKIKRRLWVSLPAVVIQIFVFYYMSG